METDVLSCGLLRLLSHIYSLFHLQGDSISLCISRMAELLPALSPARPHTWSAGNIIHTHPLKLKCEMRASIAQTLCWPLLQTA